MQFPPIQATPGGSVAVTAGTHFAPQGNAVGNSFLTVYVQLAGLAETQSGDPPDQPAQTGGSDEDPADLAGIEGGQITADRDRATKTPEPGSEIFESDPDLLSGTSPESTSWPMLDEVDFTTMVTDLVGQPEGRETHLAETVRLLPSWQPDGEEATYTSDGTRFQPDNSTASWWHYDDHSSIVPESPELTAGPQAERGKIPVGPDTRRFPEFSPTFEKPDLAPRKDASAPRDPARTEPADMSTPQLNLPPGISSRKPSEHVSAVPRALQQGEMSSNASSASAELVELISDRARGRNFHGVQQADTGHAAQGARRGNNPLTGIRHALDSRPTQDPALPGSVETQPGSGLPARKAPDRKNPGVDATVAVSLNRLAWAESRYPAVVVKTVQSGHRSDRTLSAMNPDLTASDQVPADRSNRPMSTQSAPMANLHPIEPVGTDSAQQVREPGSRPFRTTNPVASEHSETPAIRIDPALNSVATAGIPVVAEHRPSSPDDTNPLVKALETVEEKGQASRFAVGDTAQRVQLRTAPEHRTFPGSDASRNGGEVRRAESALNAQTRITDIQVSSRSGDPLDFPAIRNAGVVPMVSADTPPVQNHAGVGNRGVGNDIRRGDTFLANPAEVATGQRPLVSEDPRASGSKQRGDDDPAGSRPARFGEYARAPELRPGPAFSGPLPQQRERTEEGIRDFLGSTGRGQDIGLAPNSGSHSEPGHIRAELLRPLAPQIVETIIRHPGRPVEVTLSPEELGRVKVSLQTGDGGISVTITGERAETLDLMRRHVDALAQEFRRLGFDSIGFEFRQSGSGNQNAGHRHVSRSRDPEEIGSEPQETQTKRAGTSALDIRI